MKLDVVDIKNFSGCLVVGVIIVVKFFEFFINEYFFWVYFDIVGIVFGDILYSKGKLVIGYGICLLIYFLELIILV